MDTTKKPHRPAPPLPPFEHVKLRPVPQARRPAPAPPIKKKTSSTTKTTTMTTPAKLYGKDLSEYDEVDVDALLAQLSPEEINILAKEVDPDDNFLPPDQRCSYECEKNPTGPLDRKKLIQHINKQAVEEPDQPEFEPFVKGTVRGKKWVPPPPDARELEADEQIAIDMGEEYEHALSDATQEEIIDLAAILGFHSMMNQDQYHASLLNKGQPVGLGWDGITKSTQQKLYPADPPNNTDVDESIKRVKEDDAKLIELNFNNIKNISDEKFEQLFEALPQNEHLEVLSLTNVGLTDKTALLLAEAIEKSKTLRVLNVETNFISPPVIVTLVKALLNCRTVEEFRASNQRSSVLGNKIEMEITDLVEKNSSLLRLGLHLEFNDARHRVAAHLQRNIDRNEIQAKKSSHHPNERMTSLQAPLKHSFNQKDASSSLSSAVFKHVVDANDAVTYLDFSKNDSTANDVANNVAAAATVSNGNDFNRVNNHDVALVENKPIANVIIPSVVESKQHTETTHVATPMPPTLEHAAIRTDATSTALEHVAKTTDIEKNFKNSLLIIGVEASTDFKSNDDKDSKRGNENYHKLKNISIDVAQKPINQNGDYDSFKNITSEVVAKESKVVTDNIDSLNNNGIEVISKESYPANGMNDNMKINTQEVNESKDVKSNDKCLKIKLSEVDAESKPINGNEGKFKNITLEDVHVELKAKNFKNITGIVSEKESKSIEGSDNNLKINTIEYVDKEEDSNDACVIDNKLRDISPAVVVEELNAKNLKNINVVKIMDENSKNNTSEMLVVKNVSTENVAKELKSVHVEKNLKNITSEVVAEKANVVNGNDDKLNEISPEMFAEKSKDNESNDESSRNINSKLFAEESKVVTEESKIVTEESKVVTEESKIVTAESKVVTEESKEVTEESKVVTDESKVVTEESKVVTEESKVVTDELKLVTEESEVDTEVLKEVTDESKVVTEDSKVGTEESKVTTENSKEVISVNDDKLKISREDAAKESNDTNLNKLLTEVLAISLPSTALENVEKNNDYNSPNTAVEHNSTLLPAIASEPPRTAFETIANVSNENLKVVGAATEKSCISSSPTADVATANASLASITPTPINSLSMATPSTIAASELKIAKMQTPSSSLASSYQNLSSLQSELAHNCIHKEPSEVTLSTRFKHTVKIIDSNPNIKNYNVEVVVAADTPENYAENDSRNNISSSSSQAQVKAETVTSGESHKIISEKIKTTTIAPSIHTINKSFCIDGYQMKLVLKIVKTVNDPKASSQSKAAIGSSSSSSPLSNITTTTTTDPAAAAPAALNIMQSNAAAAAKQRDEKEI